MILKKICRISFCLFFFLTCFSIQAKEFYAILLVDTLAEGIGRYVENDFIKIKQEMKQIGENTGLSVRIISFIGPEINAKRVIKKIKSLNIKEDDVVFFYFSGHGYRTPSKSGNIWPNLLLTHNHLSVDFDDVNHVLIEKKPRLLIALADCCNNLIPDGVWDEFKVFAKGVPFKINYERVGANYKKLFLEAKGILLIAACGVDEYSYTYPSGALYTDALLDSIHTEIHLNEVDWERVLHRAAKKVSDWQHPYHVFLNR